MIIIDKNKSREFIEFLKENTKDKEFWDKINEDCSIEINKEEIDKLFKEDN